MSRKNRNNIILMICLSILTVAIFASALFGSLMLVGAESGEVKTARNSPSALVSAGAPRSQLALKQMFDSMSTVRTNGNRVIYEPITEEYLSAVTEKIGKGEKPSLSVEEVLYIISDSVSCAEKYDGVKLHGIGTVTLKKDYESRPTHISALEKRDAVYSIILYRIKSLCHEGAFETEGKTTVYYPDVARNREKKFVFEAVSDEARGDNIVFCPGDGQRITLYPSADDESADLKYMLQSDEPLSDAERNILKNSGYDADRCRNITPSYWKEYTGCKTVIIGGRIIIVDSEVGKATDSAPNGARTVSIALGDNDGDKKYELYFTAYSDNGGVAVKYDPLVGETELLMSSGFCMGAYEDFDTKAVSFYRTEQIESGSYLNLLRRVGDKINE